MIFMNYFFNFLTAKCKLIPVPIVDRLWNF